MTYEELQDVFWSLCNLLVQDEVTAPSDQHIRWKYPETGQPDWKLTDNVLFLFLNDFVVLRKLTVSPQYSCRARITETASALQ